MTSWTATELTESLPAMPWTEQPSIMPSGWQQYLQDYQLPSSAEGVSHYAGKLSVQGFDIVVQVFQRKTVCGTAIVVHGLYDHVGLYRHVIRYALQRQWRVVAFDFPGHGLSSGKRASIDSFQQYDQIFTKILSDICVHFPGELHAFGQSMGGAVLINYLLKNGITPKSTPFNSVNLFAPLVRPREWRKINYLYGLVKIFKNTIHRGRSVNSQDRNFLDFLWHHDPLQAGELGVNWLGAAKEWMKFIEQQPASEVQINIVQGDDDNTVAWRYNLDFLKQNFPQQNLLMLPTGKHHLVNEVEPLRAQMWAFFDEKI